MTSMFSAALPLPIIVKSNQAYSQADEQRDLFESHRHHIFSVAYYMTADEREAEAILGSTFIRALEQSGKPCIDKLDQVLMQELHCRLTLDPVPAMVPADVPVLGAKGLGGKNVRRTDLEEALWQLPARERLCFLLRDVEGYAPGRIAELLETSEADVQRTVLSARIRIRSLILQQRADA